MLRRAVSVPPVPGGGAGGVPAAVPVLSAGRHRTPRQGACFMEMASYLAGERWSDHPACTHPLLASAARLVNDLTHDPERSRLALLVPAVVGLTSDDPRLDARLARAAAAHALPVAAQPRQHALAVGILTCDRVLARLDGRDPAVVEPATAAALAAVPAARAWAERFTADQLGVVPVRHDRHSPRVFTRHTAPHLVALAVHGVAGAVVADPDARLRAMLTDLVELATRHAGAGAGAQEGPKRSTRMAEAATPASWSRDSAAVVKVVEPHR